MLTVCSLKMIENKQDGEVGLLNTSSINFRAMRSGTMSIDAHETFSDYIHRRRPGDGHVHISAILSWARLFVVV